MNREELLEQQRRTRIINNEKLYESLNAMMGEDNLPNELINKIRPQLYAFFDGITEFKGLVKIEKSSGVTDFDYYVKFNPTSAIMKFNRVFTDAKTKKESESFYKYLVTLKNKDIYVDKTFSVDKNNPDNIVSHRIYACTYSSRIVTRTLLHEYLSDIDEKYSSNDIVFIDQLATLIEKTDMFYKALRESHGYTNIVDTDLYTLFRFARQDSALYYGFDLCNDKYFLTFIGVNDSMKISIKLRDTKDTYISYGELIDAEENSEIAKKATSIINKLNELGINIEYRVTKKR